MVRFATWNVNSLPVRLERVERWIAEHEPDVLALQETKCTDEAFPVGAFAALGYESVHHGHGRWNGVAIVSRIGLDVPRRGFAEPDPATPDEGRLISATCGGTRVFSVYVPNGRSVESEHFFAKLDFLARLRHELDGTCRPEDPVVVCGDFNVAPRDEDVFDVSAFAGATHVTPQERAGLESVCAFGLEDVVRAAHADERGPFSWWDYRAGAFHKGEGMRIDLVLTSSALASLVTGAFVDRDARKKGSLAQAPSDHAPIVVDIGS